MTRNSKNSLFPALVVISAVVAMFPLSASDNLSLRTMALTPINADELFLSTSGEERWLPVEWSRRQPSKAIKAQTQDGVLPLFRKEAAGSDEANYAVAHQVKIPSGVREVLLFAWESQGRLQLQPIADDFLSHRHDRWLLINFTSKVIAFKVGDATKPIILNSKDSEIYTIDVGENEAATIKGAAKIQSDEPKLFYSSYFPVKSGRRTIVIFTEDGDRIRTKLIADLFKK